MVDQVDECALFEHKLSECETEVLKLSGLPLEAFERHWAHFEFEGALSVHATLSLGTVRSPYF